MVNLKKCVKGGGGCLEGGGSREIRKYVRFEGVHIIESVIQFHRGECGSRGQLRIGFPLDACQIEIHGSKHR